MSVAHTPWWSRFEPSGDITVLCLAAQSCLTLCDPIDGSRPGSSIHWDSPVKNTGVSCHFLLQGIFSTQGSNPGLLHCRQILYHISHEESPNHIIPLFKFSPRLLAKYTARKERINSVLIIWHLASLRIHLIIPNAIFTILQSHGPSLSSSYYTGKIVPTLVPLL